jgi:heme-degrading monooxygenase HmoA
MMIYLLVHHKVEDYQKWKAVYDEHQSARKQAGSQGARVLRNINDPNEEVIITIWPDVEHAQAFGDSPNLREVMQRAGVIGMPEVLFLEEIEQTQA